MGCRLVLTEHGAAVFLVTGIGIDMTLCRHLIFAVATASWLAPALAVEPADRQYEALAQLPADRLHARFGEKIEVDIDLLTSAGFSVDVVGERAEVRYRMAFNQIAEGWNWRPLADPAVDDYYQYKFLPLQSVAVERGEYAFEDKIGVTQQMKVSWRYDYFLAFENLYDFYPRAVDDEAGFSADLPASAAGHLGLRARAHLIAPVISESTTFWKATHAKPTDFTLKKRYLIGALDEVDFVDTRNGEILCRILPGQARCSMR
ncbi:MAG: hypothetical protein CVU16_15390 [Betaproteobacteria bacterium HGW-Betaproteobacteria-10]|nr:MAG: hypothetical protein CVU16_15390 [Betaproteobacteria bacterium HGW-Betaproteobacteria-10]